MWSHRTECRSISCSELVLSFRKSAVWWSEWRWLLQLLENSLFDIGPLLDSPVFNCFILAMKLFTANVCVSHRFTPWLPLFMSIYCSNYYYYSTTAVNSSWDLRQIWFFRLNLRHNSSLWVAPVWVNAIVTWI